jgi:hypothetical protein
MVRRGDLIRIAEGVARSDAFPLRWFLPLLSVEFGLDFGVRNGQEFIK